MKYIDLDIFEDELKAYITEIFPTAQNFCKEVTDMPGV